MADSYNVDEEIGIVDREDHPIIANSNSPEVARTGELEASSWSRILRE